MKLVGPILLAAAGAAASAAAAETDAEILHKFDGAIDRYLEEEHDWEPEIQVFTLPAEEADAAGEYGDLALWIDRAAPAFEGLPEDAVWNAEEEAWFSVPDEGAEAPRMLQGSFAPPSCSQNALGHLQGTYDRRTYRIRIVHHQTIDYGTTIATDSFSFLRNAAIVCASSDYETEVHGGGHRSIYTSDWTQSRLENYISEEQTSGVPSSMRGVANPRGYYTGTDPNRQPGGEPPTDTTDTTDTNSASTPACREAVPDLYFKGDLLVSTECVDVTPFFDDCEQPDTTVNGMPAWEREIASFGAIQPQSEECNNE